MAQGSKTLVHSGRMHLRVTKSPSEALALTNCAFINPADQIGDHQYVTLNGQFRFNIRTDGSVLAGHVGLSKVQRAWAQLALNDEVLVEGLDPTGTNVCADSLTVQVDFLRKGADQSAVFDSARLATSFHSQFDLHVFTIGQKFVVNVGEDNLLMSVHGIELVNLTNDPKDDGEWAVLMAASVVKFFAGPDSKITLSGSPGATYNPNAILDPKFSFGDLGIGGLDEELLVIFRRAFTSRLFPPAFIRSLGIQPVRGILLHGPPGTGKTLIARQIGKVLNAAEPKIVNGPEILNRYVGASEENIRNLFKDAEAEAKAKGDASQLHVIIFDEIDAICRQRGSRGDSTGVGDSVVTQLLSKLDGVDQLDNILVIGMTNRFDLIDEALLRPGRLELHLEIGLPSESGRLDILRIHTTAMHKDGRLADDLNLEELASLTKNYSGAELAGLVKAAASVALTRHIKVGTVAALKDDYDGVRVGRDDFLVALQDIRPAFGAVDEDLEACGIDGIIPFSDGIQAILDAGASYAKMARTDPRTRLVSVLIHGQPGTGKTALAAKIAQSSSFPFIKIISPAALKGLSEPARTNRIISVFADAYKSELSCILVDGLERLCDWNRIGPRFSTTLVGLFETLLKTQPPAGKRLLLLTTAASREVLEELGLRSCFKHHIPIPPVSSLADLEAILQATLPHRPDDVSEIMAVLRRAVDQEGRRFAIAIQDLLAIIGHAAGDEENTQQCFLTDFEEHY